MRFRILHQPICFLQAITVTATKEAGREQHRLLLEKDTSVHVCVRKQTGADDQCIFQKCGAAQQIGYV